MAQVFLVSRVLTFQSGQVMSAPVGVDSVRFDIADMDIKDGSLVLPAAPQLIVPGR